MKMFTKLIRLTMTLLLMAAIVVVQAQNDTKSAKGSNFSVQKSDLSVPMGSGEEFAIPGYNSIESQDEQKGISGTDDMKVMVLAHNGYVSTGRRAPSNGSNYQREIYLLKPSEMAASGIATGNTLNSIGWTVYAVGNTTLTGTLNIWLMNTSDATYNVGLDWATALAGFQQVYTNGSYVTPIALGWFDVAFTSNFNYTGGGVYVAWEFSSTETPATTVVSHYIFNDTPSSFMASAYNNTSLPATLLAGVVRPQTRLGLAGVDDIVGVTSVYTLEKAPVPYGAPVKLGAGLQNISASPVTTDVTIQVIKVSDNSVLFTNTNVGFTIPAASYAKVPFADWTSPPTPPVEVKYTVTTAAIPGDTWTVNNTKTILGNVNNNLYSYFYTPQIASNFGGGAGIFSVKYTMTGIGMITGVNVVIGTHTTNTGKIISGILLNSAGNIVAQSDPYTILLGDLGTSKTFNFNPVLFNNDFFYIGIYADMLLGVHYPVAIANELPQRGGMIYSFDYPGGTAFEETLDYKCLIEAKVVGFTPINLGVTNISAASSQLKWTSSTGLSDVEFGPAGIPPPAGTPTHPNVTSPLTVTTAPNTSYSFYVRDNSGGTYSDWVGPYTFSTFCQDCPVGAIAEGEPQLLNGSTLAGTNGGCAVGDPLLTSPIALGDIYCGQSNTFLDNTGANARDNDYYYLDLNTPACIYWTLTITLQGNSLVNVTLFDAGDMTCAIGAVAAVSTTSACEVATINAVVPSGNYYIVARVASAAGNLWPAGSGPWQYVLTVNGSQLGAPNLDPDPPASVSLTVPPGGSTLQNISIDNSGNYDLEYTAATSGAYNAIFADNFDTYVAGVQLAGQSGGNWTTWGGTSGGADDGFVTNAQAFSPANSFVVTPNIDQVHLFGDLTGGVYRISFMNYIAAGKAGYFNILSDFTFGTGGYWAVDMYFNVDGTIDVVSNHTTITAPFAWTPGVWKKVEVIVDLDNDVAEAIYDGQSIYSWPWSEGGSNGTGPLIIDAIDFYGATADDEMYVDNFLVELAGLDWLTLNGGLGVSGLVAPSDPADIIAIGVNAGTYPVGIYNKVINMTTNELCGAKNTYAITVTMNVGYSISGNVYYGIAVPGTKPMETGTTVTLTPGSAVSTGTGGAYDFRPLAGGGANYTLSVATTKAYNFAAGVANNDALFINRYVLGNLQLTTVQKRAGDVNFNNEVAGNDALFIKRRVLGNITAWPAPNLNWVYATTGDDMPFGPPNAINGPKQVTISGANVIVDLRMLETGDVNSSWTPPAE